MFSDACTFRLLSSSEKNTETENYFVLIHLAYQAICLRSLRQMFWDNLSWDKCWQLGLCKTLKEYFTSMNILLKHTLKAVLQKDMALLLRTKLWDHLILFSSTGLQFHFFSVPVLRRAHWGMQRGTAGHILWSAFSSSICQS